VETWSTEGTQTVKAAMSNGLSIEVEVTLYTHAPTHARGTRQDWKTPTTTKRNAELEQQPWWALRPWTIEPRTERCRMGGLYRSCSN